MDDRHRLEREDKGIDFLECLLVLLRRKVFIISCTVGITVLTTIVSLLAPISYRAESKILPPSPFLGQLTGLGMIGASLGWGAITNTPGDLYVGLLKSRPVLDAVVDRFSLMERYRTTLRELARSRLERQLTAVEDKKTGIVTITVEERDPKRAAEMANAFVEELKALSKRLVTTEAGQRRLFFEEQLKDAKQSLSQSEESLKGFEREDGRPQDG